MKKTGILHAELSRLVAGMGHHDLLVIGDAGLPVPKGVAVIDLAPKEGVPGSSRRSTRYSASSTSRGR